MHRPATIIMLLIPLFLFACRRDSSSTAPDTAFSGEQLFFRLCSSCHPNGGNSIYPPKTLHRMTLAANGITTPDQIMEKMRHPGPRMKAFSPQELSDSDARRIADYILATFR